MKLMFNPFQLATVPRKHGHFVKDLIHKPPYTFFLHLSRALIRGLFMLLVDS